jgi:hypothetical protein
LGIWNRLFNAGTACYGQLSDIDNSTAKRIKADGASGRIKDTMNSAIPALIDTKGAAMAISFDNATIAYNGRYCTVSNDPEHPLIVANDSAAAHSFALEVRPTPGNPETYQLAIRDNLYAYASRIRVGGNDLIRFSKTIPDEHCWFYYNLIAQASGNYVYWLMSDINTFLSPKGKASDGIIIDANSSNPETQFVIAISLPLPKQLK